MSHHICRGLDGIPTILCFDAESLALFSDYRAFIERKSGGTIRLVQVIEGQRGIVL